MSGNTVDIRVVAHDLATRTMDGVGKGLLGIGKGMKAIAAAGTAVQVLSGAAAAGAQLLPIALTLPAALGAGAFAMATFKTATAGFSDALNAKDAKAFAEATKDMPAPMREAAQAGREVKESFKAVQKEVQASFWDGMAEPIKKLGATYLPVLNERMVNIATGMNLMGKNLANGLQSPLVVGAVKKIGDNTANMFLNMKGAAANFGTGLIKLGGIGSTYLPQVGTAIDKVAEKFSNWVNAGSADGSIKKMIDGAIAGFKDLGAIGKNVGSILASVFRGLAGGAASPLASLRELTARVAEFMKSLQAQNALRAFGDMLRTVARVVQDVLMAALRQLAPIIEQLSPVVATVAEALGKTLTSAIEVVGPIIRNLATWMNENKETLAKWAQAALVAWAAFKGYTILTAVAAAIRGVVTAAAAGGGLAGVAGLLAKVAGVVGLGLIAKQLDDINMSAAGMDASKLGYFEGELHNMVGAFQQLATDPGSVFTEIADEWNKGVQDFKTGASDAGLAFAELKRMITGFEIKPFEVDVKTDVGRAKVDSFMKEVSSVTPMVNINGNTNEAGFALRTILAEIAAGRSTVNIDGQAMPAQEALRMVMNMISTSAGIVTINGNKMPAGEALAGLIQEITGQKPVVNIGANTSGANSSLQGFVNTWNGYTIRMNAVVSSRIGGLAKGGAGSGMTWVGERGPELVRTMAGGGNRGRGRTLVGERGPELVNLPPGSQVTPTGKTQAMLAAQGGSAGGGGGSLVSFAGGLDSAFATLFMKLVRERKIIIQGV